MGCGPSLAFPAPLKFLSCNHLLTDGNAIFMSDGLMAWTRRDALWIGTALVGALLVAVPMIVLAFAVAISFEVAVFAISIGRWQLRKIAKGAWGCFAVLS